MRLSIQRLRWVLLTGAVLLLAVLAGYIAYGRWRTMQTAIRIIQRAGVHITHDTNGFTYSQSVQGRTIFTLHAKTATQVGNGKWTLHDAEMTLYNRIPGRPDHVYGSEVEYDENDGVARAIGEVHMDLQAPEAFAENGHVKPQTAEDAAQHVIHVKTSGLVYLRKLGVAATDQLVDFNYNGMHCTAMGAEFNTGSNVLRLLKDVTMDGTTHEKPVHLTALDADIDRNDNFATLDHPVVRSEGRTGSSDSGLVNFEADGSIHRLQGSGDVVLSEGTRQITAAHLDARLNDDMELTEAHLSGGVGLIDTDPTRPMQGSASRVDAAFDAKGQPVSVTATGGAHVAVVDHRANPQGMGRGLGRSMEGTKIVALFKAGPHARGAKPQTQLTEVDAYGAARASGESVAAAAKGAGAGAAPGVRTMRVGADELRVSFAERADGAAQPKHMAGAGHTMLEQMAPMGEHETSTGDTLEMFFAAKTMDGATSAKPSQELAVSSAVQVGNVVMHDQAASSAAGAGAMSSGTAQRAAYDEASSQVTLTGDVHWMNDRGQMIAPRVVVNQQTEDADASGGVQATLLHAGPVSAAGGAAGVGRGAGGSEAQAQATHILASTAAMHHATQVSEFRGTDAQPAKMWQGGSQVQAALLLFDGAKQTFSARPAAPGTMVHAVLVSSPAAAKDGKPEGAATVLRIASPKMDYSGLQHEATFADGVTMEGSLGQVRGRRAVVFLTEGDAGRAGDAKPDADGAMAKSAVPFGGSVDRVVVYGDVRLMQPGRNGSGDELLYTAGTGNYVLTGTPERPPVVVDAQQGSVTGKTLLFGDAGSTIVVAGKPGGRVRTETEVRQQSTR